MSGVNECRALPAWGISAGEEIPRSFHRHFSPLPPLTFSVQERDLQPLGSGQKEGVSPGSCVSGAQVTVAS